MESPENPGRTSLTLSDELEFASVADDDGISNVSLEDILELAAAHPGLKITISF